MDELKTKEIYAGGYSGTESVGRYTAKTFGWMFTGLLTTFIISIAMIFSGGIFVLYSIPAMPFILLLAEFGVVIYLSARLERLSVGAARGLFFAYAVLNGIVFSAIFLGYGLWSAMLAFAVTSLYFGIMAGVGYFTKIDLSGMRPILFSGAIFLAIYWVLSMFFTGLSVFDRAICLIGIAVFLGFTAYDTQKIRAYHAAFGSQPEIAQKASIYAALQLYLDFINLFLYLLRFMGKKN